MSLVCIGTDIVSAETLDLLGRGLLLLVLVPLIELVLLNQLVQEAGLPFTILVVLLTGVVGVSLARHQGVSAWRGVHQQMAQGRSPSSEILDGVMILLAGALLMTPGLLTDTVGFSLLVPAVRRRLRGRLTEWFRTRTVTTFKTQFPGVNPFGERADDDESGPTVRVVDPDVPSDPSRLSED